MMAHTLPPPQSPPASLALAAGPISAVDLALFAAASGDHNPLHLDAEAARSAGFDKPVVHGMLTMAHVGRMFTQHFGAGSVLRLQTRFTGSAAKGDTLHLRATLLEAHAGRLRYGIQGTGTGGAPLVTGEALVRHGAQG
jgi:acyl dehydratase